MHSGWSEVNVGFTCATVAIDASFSDLAKFMAFSALKWSTFVRPYRIEHVSHFDIGRQLVSREYDTDCF